MTSDAQTLTDLMPSLIRLARILAPSPDMAEDMAQEALLRVWARMKNGATIEDLRPYLMTTLRNASTKPAQQHQELTEQNTPGKPAEVWSRFACGDVNDAITRLPADQADLLRMAVMQGTSYAEIAKTFDLPIGTVMSRISRARAQLRADLDLPKSRAVETLLQDMAS